MVRLIYVYTAVLILLILPIAFMLGMRFFNPFRTFDIYLVYFAAFASGPCLLIYGFILRTEMHEKVISLIALIVGGLWLGSEIVIVIKGSFFE